MAVAALHERPRIDGAIRERNLDEGGRLVHLHPDRRREPLAPLEVATMGALMDAKVNGMMTDLPDLLRTVKSQCEMALPQPASKR
jgi:hypothetical protein